jgi:hypothetical protein
MGHIAHLRNLGPYVSSLIKFGQLVLEKKIFLKTKFSVFYFFRYYLPLKKGFPLHLNKIESPLSNDDLCQVWLKLTQWFWRRFFK